VGKFCPEGIQGKYALNTKGEVRIFKVIGL
jgi:hypothetical protein